MGTPRGLWLRLWFALLTSVALLLALSWLLSQPKTVAAQQATSTAGWRVIRSDSTGLVLELATPHYQLTAVTIDRVPFERLQAPGLEVTTAAGQPQLPYASVLLGAPPDARLEVRILEAEGVSLPDVHRLLPAPVPAPSEGLQPGTWRYDLDSAKWQSQLFYPAITAHIAEVAWLRDQRVARLELYPFQYQPASGAVWWYRRLLVRVDFSPTDPQSAQAYQPVPPLERGPFEAVLSSTLVNYEIARAWRARPLASSPRRLASSATMPVTTTWFKVVVNHDGLYRLTYSDLQTAGVPVDTVDPRYFHLVNQGDEVALEVVSRSGAQFEAGDYVIFYGQKFYGDRFAAGYALESNNWLTFSNGWHPQYTPKWAERYTDNNVYWLTVGDTPGLRVSTIDGRPTGAAPQPDYYTATVHAEDSNSWQTTTFTGEDPFFWQRVSASTLTTRTYTSTLSSIAVVPISATVRGEVVGVNQNPDMSPDHHTQFYIDNAAQPFQDVYWDGMTRLRFEGKIAPNDLISGANWVKMAVYKTAALTVTGDQLLFDWYEVTYPRQFRALSDQITFNGDQLGARQYRISDFVTDTLWAYNISNPLRPQRVLSVSVSGTAGAYTATFEVSHTAPITYVMASVNALQSPQAITSYQPPDWYSSSNEADYVLIAPRAFYTSAQALANYRTAQGLRVKVVDLDDVFNEFGDGIYNPIAIKNFLKYAYEHWQPPAPTYAILIGDGHFNFKNYPVAGWSSPPLYMPPNLAWVDPWQGEVDSANLLVNFVGNDILPDMIISRIPVNSAQELKTIISRTINYEQAGFQPWQKNHLFIADNVPDSAGDFVGASEYTIQHDLPPEATALRLYQNDFGCPSNCNGIRFAITNTVNVSGVFLMNYVGHGTVPSWSGESIFTTGSLPTFANTRLPIALSWTCLDGYWLYPRLDYQSLIETALRSASGSIIAAFSPTGLGVSTGHDTLQKGFYSAIFRDGVQRVGQAAIGAKLDLFATGGNYDLINTFTLFGDPALRLPTFSMAVVPLTAARSGANGTIVTYTFAVSNSSYLSDTITARATSIWPVSAGSVDIGPGQAAAFVISVTIPFTAVHNSQDVAAAVIQSIGDETYVPVTITTTAIHYEGHLSAPIVTQAGDPGATVTYTLQLNNLGGMPDTFDLIANNSWPITLSQTTATLSVSQSANITVNVHIPSEALATAYDTALIQARSRGNQIAASLALTTTVNEIDGLAMTPLTSTLLVKPGTRVTHTLRLTNTGNLTSAVGLAGNGNVWPITIDPAWVSALAPRQGMDAALSTEAPFTSTKITDRVDVIAVLQAGTMPAVTSYLTTTTIYFSNTLSVAPDAQTTEPGRAVTYTVRLTNTGEAADTFDLLLGDHTWPIDLATSTVTLDVSQSITVEAAHTIPADAFGDSVETVGLQAVSRSSGARSAAQFTTTAALLHGLDLQPLAMIQSIKPGNTAMYTLRLTNTGNITVPVNLEGSAALWPPVINPSALAKLPPHTGVDIDVSVNVPLLASATLDAAVVTATLQAGPALSVTARLTTTTIFYSSDLAVTPAAQTADPGKVVTYTVYVTNTGEAMDTFDLVLGDHAWPIGLAAPVVTLDVSQSITVETVVAIPSEAMGGSADPVRLRAVSRGNWTYSAALFTTTAKVLYGIDLQPTDDTRTVKVGSTATYTLRITNTGNVTVPVNFEGSATLWPPMINPPMLTGLSPRSGSDIAIMVSVPPALSVAFDTATITATVPVDPPVQATAFLTTRSELYQLLLPLLASLGPHWLFHRS